MRHSIVQSALIAFALFVCANLSLAADTKSSATGETKAVNPAKAAEKSAKAKNAKTAAKVKVVDINGAGKKELMTLPGIGDAEAEKIIAGRPYLVKAHLVTHGILTRPVYDNLKGLVIAKQKPEYLEKAGKK